MQDRLQTEEAENFLLEEPENQTDLLTQVEGLLKKILSNDAITLASLDTDRFVVEFATPPSQSVLLSHANFFFLQEIGVKLEKSVSGFEGMIQIPTQLILLDPLPVISQKLNAPLSQAESYSYLSYCSIM